MKKIILGLLTDLKYEQEQEVGIREPLELLKQVFGYEREDGVLGGRNVVVLQGKQCQLDF